MSERAGKYLPHPGSDPAPDYDHTPESVMHYRHRNCANAETSAWWSLSSGRNDRAYFCPYCGMRLIPASYRDAPLDSAKVYEVPL